MKKQTEIEYKDLNKWLKVAVVWAYVFGIATIFTWIFSFL